MLVNNKTMTRLSHRRACTHFCLIGGWQGQHGGLGHGQAALMVVHTVGHVCPSQITEAVRHSATHSGKRAVDDNK